MLGVEEVKKLMDDVGYKVDEHYVNGVMDVFAKFDDDKRYALCRRSVPWSDAVLIPRAPLNLAAVANLNLKSLSLCGAS